MKVPLGSVIVSAPALALASVTASRREHVAVQSLVPAVSAVVLTVKRGGLGRGGDGAEQGREGH